MVDMDKILLEIIKEEMEFFYSHIREYDDSRIIDIVIADDMYKKALEYNPCEEQYKAIKNLGNTFNNRNGTVLFAPSTKETTLVLLSKPMLEGKDMDELHGTLVHELTHAHDFYDYVDYLKVEDHNQLFVSEFYNAFHNWTEFNARRNGYKRFIEYKFRKSWKQFKRNIDFLLENAKLNFVEGLNEERNLYELMQVSGRYSILDSLSSKISGDFTEDILKGVVDEKEMHILTQIYTYLITHFKFEDFSEIIAEFDELLKQLSKFYNLSLKLIE